MSFGDLLDLGIGLDRRFRCIAEMGNSGLTRQKQQLLSLLQNLVAALLLVEQRQCLVEMGNRLRIGWAGKCLFRCQTPILHRLPQHIGFCRVMSQDTRRGVFLLLQHLEDLPVNLLTAPVEQAFVGRITNQCMLEDVSPVTTAAGKDQFDFDQALKRIVDSVRFQLPKLWPAVQLQIHDQTHWRSAPLP